MWVAFEKLKEAVTSTPVLALPDLKKLLMKRNRNRAVLMQGGKPIAFASKGFGQKGKVLSTYEKEILAVLMAIDKRRHYSEGGSVVIKTDRRSLKHLKDQRLTHSLQHKVLPYGPRVQNRVKEMDLQQGCRCLVKKGRTGR